MNADTRRLPPALPAVWLVLLAAAGTFALTMGTRQTMGLFLGNLNTATGLGIASISLAFAFGQLWWGLTQPFAGALADRHGPTPVLLAGVTLVAIGTVITPYMGTTLGLVFAIGVLSAGGAGMAGPSVLMAATTRLVPADRRGLATGVVNAGGSFGQFVMAPLAGVLIGSLGWASAMQVLGLLVLLALPAAFVLRGGVAAPTAAGTPAVVTLPAREALKRAWALPSFRLLSAGFFVCGFHVAFLATHLPGVVASCGLSTEVAAWALAVLLFLAAPKTPTVMLLFAAVMGVTFLSTVPPTAGLVAKFFGPGNMAMLFGVVMLSHQVGGFLGAWLGGVVYARTGSYDWIWYADVLLAFAAALIHLPIDERPLPRPAAQATT